MRQAKSIRGLTGAVIGTFYPNLLMEKVFGQELESGPTFAYLFRRFGYPVYGWDGYKELCCYTLTTPMRGVCLGVSIKNGVDFRYMISQKLEQICQQERHAPYDAWNSRFQTWAREKGYRPLYRRWSNDTDQAEIDAVATTWLAARGLTSEEVTDEIVREFWDEQEARLKAWTEEYQVIEPWPKVPEDEIYGETWTKVWGALERAMRELLRPVRVRDGTIDIKGQVSDGGRKPLEESSMAGLGIGWLYDIYLDKDKQERWWNCVDAVRKNGKGDLLAGLENLLAGQSKK